jgi:hypothetical protein
LLLSVVEVPELVSVERLLGLEAPEAGAVDAVDSLEAAHSVADGLWELEVFRVVHFVEIVAIAADAVAFLTAHMNYVASMDFGR